MLAREDRVDDERLEARIPEPALLSGACVHLGGREGDVAGVPQHALADLRRGIRDALFEDIDDDVDELQRLLQAHRTQELARRRVEHVARDPRGTPVIFEPRHDRGDARLRHQADRAAAARRYYKIDAHSIVVRALSELARRGEVDASVVQTAIDRYDLNNPAAGESGSAGGDA